MPRRTGAIGEDAAAAWFEAQGYQVLARNVRWRSGEIDLVVRRGAVVVVVEVKSRTGDGFGHPADAVTPRKRRRLTRLAARYLALAGLDDAVVRFDAVAVHLTPEGQVRSVEHLPDAFSASR
ncbi:MAG: YraN family protein [Armatimonadota bacterium]|nr:YraN family protein [Armatimonadota bacterium]MDR7532873.1 YraN family protein [Armatimonadota bacterium]MDR7536080.1 YraN family protein [Armatimonadota bacterium]